MTRMSRFLLSLIVVGLVSALLVGGAGAVTRLTTTMTGAEEAPGPGDPDATGTATITLNQGLRTVCFELSWTNIDGTVTAAHIHEAPAGAPGGVVVPLFSGAFNSTDSTSGCVTGVSRALIKDIRKNPEDYYVNVHSTVFPAGAIRGQLG